MTLNPKLKNLLLFLIFLLLAGVSLFCGAGLLITKVFFPYHGLAGFMLHVLFVILLATPLLYRLCRYIFRGRDVAAACAGVCLIVALICCAATVPDVYSSSGNRQSSYLKTPFLEAFEKNAVNFWMPVHVSISRFLSSTRLARKDDFLISENQLRTAAENFEPADIIFMRKNWYLSNIATGGFWKHAAIYLGDLAELDAYFRDECRKRYGVGLSELLKVQYPLVYEELDNNSRTGSDSIIEALADGVRINLLMKSARSDSLAVIRPRLSKEAKLDSLIYTFQNHDKPYDFRFDYSTNQVLYCSELVSKAFAYPEKESILFDVPISSGRPLLEPNDMVENFHSWRNSAASKGDVIVYFTDRKGGSAAYQLEERAFWVSWKKPNVFFNAERTLDYLLSGVD